MRPEEVLEEIKKLKQKRLELVNRMNSSISFDEREGLRRDVERIQRQIETLERLAGKSFPEKKS